MDNQFVVEQKLNAVGSRIKRVRVRRNISAKTVSEDAGISIGTLKSIEKGISTVSIGAYASVLHALEWRMIWI